MRCWSRKGKGWKAKAKVEVKEKVKVGGKGNVKWLMTNGKGTRERTCLTSTNNGHGHETLSEGIMRYGSK